MTGLRTPSLRDELERKAARTLVDTIGRYERMEIGRSRALAIVDALWGVASGLVSVELNNTIASARDVISDEDIRVRPRRLFRKGAKLATVESLPQPSTKMHLAINPGTFESKLKSWDFEEEDAPYLARAEEEKKVVQRLIDHGFEEF